MQPRTIFALKLLPRRLFFSLLLSLYLVGCQPIPSSTPVAVSPSPIPTLAIPTQTSVPTATPAGMYPTTPVSFENLSEWHFARPFVFEDWPALIVPDDDAYKLDESYEVESIEMSYQWWGLGDPVFNYQQIRKSNSGYALGGKTVSTEKVKTFLKSIGHLHPTPQTLSSITHTDDYPIWAIELTGTDGTKILLTSSSNTPAYVPWNLIYNGEIYAQFDGSIAAPLAELFAVEEGQPAAAFFPGGGEEGKLIVSSNGWPNQLNYGFSGLLPLHTAFTYRVDPETGEITGLLDGRSSIGGFGHMVIGSVTTLEKIVLEKSNKSEVDCSIEILKSDDPSAKQWSFKCPVETAHAEGPYLYPVSVTFGTDAGEEITSSGTLFGNWKGGVLLPHIPFPPEVAQALKEYDAYNALAKDRLTLLLKFDAKVDPLKGKLDEGLNADIVFVGQLDREGRKLPYSLTTSLGVENGKIVRWDIDTKELDTFLQDVLKQPITDNLLAEDPYSTLNLYYFESGDKFVNLGFSEGTTFAGQNGLRLTACEGLPWRENLPDEQTALREFAVNGSWDEREAQLVLLDDTVRVLDLYTSTSAEDHVPFSTLLPQTLFLKGRSPLRVTAYSTWGPIMYLDWFNNASQADIDAYKAMIEQLPGTKEFHKWGVSLEDAVFVVNEKGTLDLIECKKSQ